MGKIDNRLMVPAWIVDEGREMLRREVEQGARLLRVLFPNQKPLVPERHKWAALRDPPSD